MSEEKSFSGGGIGDKEVEMPRGRHFRRILPYLARLYQNKGEPVTYDDLNDECRKQGIKRSAKINDIKNHVNWLISIGFPIGKTDDDKIYWDYLEASQLLDGTKVLGALRLEAASKLRLAKKVVDEIENTYPIFAPHVYMGTGTTVHAVFREMLKRRALKKLGSLDTVYTDNLLIVFEYMHKKPDFNLEVVNGKLYRDWARIDHHREQLDENMPVSLSITSFKGFNKDHGFSSDDENDRNKKMTLKPHDACRIVIVPMSLDKFGTPGKDIVARVGDLKEKVKYIFVTDKSVSSRNAVNKEHMEHKEHMDELLAQAKKAGLNIEIQYAPKETNGRKKGRFKIKEIPPKQNPPSQLAPDGS